VASAVLFIFEELGYLSMALTAEPFRRRGAQSEASRDPLMIFLMYD
jgi:hypothetical protein